MFIALKGVEYRIRVSGFGGRGGAFRRDWETPGQFDEPCGVPDVRGARLNEARKTLHQANCLVGRVVRTSSPIVPRGRVIAQYPFPEARLPILSRVDLQISSGPAR